MATAAILGAAPTLSSAVGIPPTLAGALSNPVPSIADTDSLSLHRKRSTQIKYLHSLTKYTLHMWPNGTVNGMTNTSNSTTRKYAMLEFITTFFAINLLGSGEEGDPRIQIRGVESKMWLCMSKKGELYGSSRETDDCEFHEEYDSLRDCYTYYSVQHPDNTDKTVKWYVALNRHGRSRQAITTKHKSSRFITTASHVRKDDRDVNIEIKSPNGTRNKSRYTRLPNKDSNSKPHRTVKNRRIIDKKKPRRRGRNKDIISDILSSIELAISANSKEVSSLENFQDSMLIDLGKTNPFYNPDTGDKIKHPSRKISGSRRRKKTYRRKQSAARL